MKKYLNATMLGILVTSLLFSCKKSNSSKDYPEENPLPGFFAASGFDQIVYANYGSDFYERGFSFRATVTGKITALVIKIPAANSSVRVTIWDSTSKAVLRTESINIPAANTEITIPIGALAIEKNKPYVISMNTQDSYGRYRSDLKSVTYPILSGNIIVTNFKIYNTTAQSFPIYDEILNLRFFGDIGFKFKRTE